MNKTTLAYFTIEDNYFVFTRTNYFDDNTKSIERAKAEKELARLEKERKAAQKDIDFLSGKLSNQGFLSKAPAQKIENERVKLAKSQEKMEKIMLSIEKMK